MKSLKSQVHNTMNFSSEIIREYPCPECGEMVKELKITVKGKINVTDRCKVCDDRQVEKAAFQAYKKIQISKRECIFNEFSLISDGLKRATFENYHPLNEELVEAKKQAINYINNYAENKGLIFVGDYGVGKSHLSYSICKKAREKGLTSIFISVPELLTKLKSTFNKNGDHTEKELLTALKNVDLLVLDDIGADYPTEWSISKIFEVINSRVGKNNIYTTNSNSKALITTVGKRNFSRMMENAQLIKMSGEDYRLRNLKF